MLHQLLLWGGFNLFVIAMLALDLGVFHRKAHEIKFKEALLWSIFWFVLALIFNAGLYLFEGRQKAVEFLAAFLVERALSVDNLFVFILIFSFFQIPAKYHHKVLFWGILGALVMRAAFIGMGVALIYKFHWIIYVFGAFLVYTGIKIAFEKEKEIRPDQNPVVKFVRRFMPVTDQYEEGKFFVKKEKRTFATLLFLVVIVVEISDIIFAMDSVPACLAISLDPFIVYSSNVFAILGLRALYFLIAGAMKVFHYLNYGLSAILSFVGLKMLLADVYPIPVGAALGVICAMLGLAIAASLIWPKNTQVSS